MMWAPGQSQPSWPGWRQVGAAGGAACLLLVCIVHTALVRKGAGRDCMATPRRQQHEPCPFCCSLPPPGADIARRERGSTAGEGEEGVLSGDSMDLEGAGGSRAMPSPIAQSALAERQRQQQDGESACLLCCCCRLGIPAQPPQGAQP